MIRGKFGIGYTLKPKGIYYTLAKKTIKYCRTSIVRTCRDRVWFGLCIGEKNFTYINGTAKLATIYHLQKCTTRRLSVRPKCRQSNRVANDPSSNASEPARYGGTNNGSSGNRGPTVCSKTPSYESWIKSLKNRWTIKLIVFTPFFIQ